MRVGNRRILLSVNTDLTLDKSCVLVYNISVMKKRTNYNLNEEQHKVLRIAAAYRGISASELLRRILDEWIESNAQDIQIQVVSHEKADSGD